MKNRISVLLFVAILLLPMVARADEGMWLVHIFGKSVYEQMRAKGLKLGAKELYNEEAPALCDAVVAINGGIGTGSIISPDGLLITNHHVAYGDIHKLSTPENNLLENGFWAASREQELAVPEATASFLRKVVDITDEAHAVRDSLITAGRWNAMGNRILSKVIKKRYGKTTKYELDCVGMWHGEKYFLFYYETFTDVRLVAAPPEKLGAFGGDIDNWGWPQHKCDFAMYRVYADKDGKPAKYSADNVPIKPVKYLQISTSGVHDGDFSMVIGYPYQTHRYLSSYAVLEKMNVRNPIVIKERHTRLDVMKRHMQADSIVRLKYSDKYFNISNYADYAKWENKCLRRYNVPAVRRAEEIKLQQWIDADAARKAKYGNILADLERGYAARAEALKYRTYFQESWLGPSEILLMANRISACAERMEHKHIHKMGHRNKEFSAIENSLSHLNKNFDYETDKDVMTTLMQDFTNNVPQTYWGQYLRDIYAKNNGNIKKIIDEACEKSVCISAGKIKHCFEIDKTHDEILADPLVAIANSMRTETFLDSVEVAEKRATVDVSKAEALYQKAIYEYRSDNGIAQYPDANGTMRLTYGNVEPIYPYDAVKYDYRSTIKGYTEKYNPDEFEFRVDDKMQKLIKNKDWGRWGENGTLYVNFLTNNDITGGNSGSPVLNGKGNLIGLAFDGNRESMSGDIYFHPDYFKTVCVDIRFVLWCVEKYGNAAYLIDEMKLVK